MNGLQTLIEAPSLRIERIVSDGHVSPPGLWYDQSWAEWVVLLRGQATLMFEGGKLTELGVGDHLHIPARVRHRVEWTVPGQLTIWLAIHYDREAKPSPVATSLPGEESKPDLETS